MVRIVGIARATGGPKPSESLKPEPGRASSPYHLAPLPRHATSHFLFLRLPWLPSNLAAIAFEGPMRITSYKHHGRHVKVRADLKGKHWDYCLCNLCARFVAGSEENCAIARDVYAVCVKHDLVTPVWECPAFLLSRKYLRLVRFVSSVKGGFVVPDSVKKLLKNKWLYVVALGLVALLGGGAYSDQVKDLLLAILGG